MEKRPASPTGAVPSFAPGSRGWAIRVACELEASAPKPGNVHPALDYDDLSHAELVAAGAALAPAFDAAPERRLGETVRDAVSASRRVTRSNANLGIVLAAAPLAAVPRGAEPSPDTVARTLGRLGPADARDCWAAISAARPGGMGRADRWDVGGDPPADLMAAMHTAADRDLIARLWARGYEPLFQGPVTDLERELRAGRPIGDAIVRAFLRQLSREPDTLIARKHGPEAAAAVSRRSAAVIAAGEPGWRRAARALELDLVAGRNIDGFVPPPAGTRPGTINPGTTADLVAAALYVLLVTGRLPASALGAAGAT